MQNNTNQEYNEITFASIGRFLKKSFVIALIVVVCSCLLFSVIFGSLVLFGKTENQYLSLQIEYSHSGIEEGKDPMGETFNYNAIKSSKYVESSLAETGIENDVQDIISNIFVTPVIPAEIVKQVNKEENKLTINNNTVILDDGTTYYARKYQVVFNYTKLENAMSEKNATIFMNKLVETYKTEFMKKYSEGRPFSTTFFEEEYKTLDYIDYYTFAKAKIDELDSFISKQMASQTSSFISPTIKKTYADLSGELEYIRQALLETYKSQVTTYSLTKDLELIISKLENAKSDCTIEISAEENYIRSLKEQLANYDKNDTMTPGADGNGNIIVNEQDKEYQRLQANLDNANMRLKELNIQLDIIEKQLAGYSSSNNTLNTTENQARAEALIKNINESMIALYKDVNVLNSEFMSSSLNENTIKTVVPVTATTEKPSISRIILMYVLVIIISYAIGLIVYKCIDTRKKNKLASASASDVEVKEVEEIEAKQEEVKDIE